MIAQILVADDDENVLSTLRDFLESLGHRVVTAKDGYGAWQAAHDHAPHLVILDIMMPGHYGPTVYEILQNDSYTSSIPIIFISGLAAPEVEKMLPKDPKTRFIAKPLDLENLEKTIKELLPRGGYIP
ncbi:MAG: hypothetical protein A3G41_08570 [Elusimicrobia bacterium RIFCSPLOWO2_12_FULL_59_9]|nr:MAG: hypothetical protein A3G41_08570 [Elusimicrobia bacterium RIFCSPLOWO2_12_FULL_59_9]